MPSSPYTDLARPPLPARALQRALLVPGGLWRHLDLKAETASTNADVAEAARRGEPEGLIVVAEQQVAGRGRRDRQWVSPPRAGLTLSVLLRPGDAVPNRRWGWLPLLAGVALLEAVQRIAEVDAALKWPNDLLVQDAKCAGILAEVIGDAVVLGIGLNVTTRVDELPVTGGLPATSLQIAGREEHRPRPAAQGAAARPGPVVRRMARDRRRRGVVRAARRVPARVRDDRPGRAGAPACRRRPGRRGDHGGRRRPVGDPYG